MFHPLARALETLNTDTKARSQGDNTLRNNKHMKSPFETETYCKMIHRSFHRLAFAKFRARLVLCVETGGTKVCN